MERKRYKRCKKFNAQAAEYKIKLKNLDGKNYKEVCSKFQGIMKNILQDILQDSKPEDMVRFNVHSSRFDGGDINTPFQAREDVGDDHIAALIDHTMQSNDEINMEDDFILNVIHVDIPSGRGRRRIDVNMGINIIKKHSVITGMKDWTSGPDRDDDIHCFAYALAILMRLRTDNYEKTRTWSRRRENVIAAVHDYHRRAGVEPGAVDPGHYQRFQNILPENVRLVVVDALQPSGLLYKGDSGDEIVAILYYEGHYWPLKKLKSWFGVGYYCVDCEKGAKTKNKHKCRKDYKCKKCLSKRCERLPKILKYCKNCRGMFSNPECLQDHVTNGVCQSATSCPECAKWFSSEVLPHNCNATTCAYCKKNHPDNHCCFIEPSDKKPGDKFRIVCYDFESTQVGNPEDEVKQHRVNYAVAMSFCSECGDEMCGTCSQVHHFSSLDGGDALVDFCLWAFSDPINKKSTFIAHNAGGYDSHFILEYLVKEGNTPQLIMQGGKILCMTVPGQKIRFIDSLSFLAMGLNDFTTTFDLPDITKGTFPHLFNTAENYGYVGPLPPLHYYSPDSLKENSRKKLLEWHHQHRNDNFVFAHELSAYCEADVVLLRAGCRKFRSSFISSTGVDPFRQITIASTCMEVFRRRHLPPQTIG